MKKTIVLTKTIILTNFLVASFLTSYAQTTVEVNQTDNVKLQTQGAAPSLTFSGYIDAYYGYDFNKPVVYNYTNGGAADGNLRPTFLYSHNRHNEFNVNNAFVKAAYAADRVRANVAIQVGTYAQYNYAAEEGLLRNVYEANAGIRLGKDFWLDAGVFASHIGSESAISKDCWTLTRSISADNTPYYLSGAKVSYTPGDSKWSFTGLVVNGWQRIRENNGNKAIGTQIQFKPNSRWLFNSSTFFGNEQPTGTPGRTRYFHDFYTTFQATERLSLMGLADVGFQCNGADDGYDKWSGWVIIARYQLSDHFFVAGRVENYSDPNGVIISSNSAANGFQTTELPGANSGVATPGFKVMNYSLNLDYKPADNVLFRVEGRLFDAKNAIFVKEGKEGNLSNYTKSDPVLATSIAVSF